MDANNNWNNVKYKTFTDYLNHIRNHLAAVLTISILILLGSMGYAFFSEDIYTANTLLKISKPEGNILDAPLLPEFGDRGSDRFIANEIETMKNISIRKQVASVMIDTFMAKGEKNKFSLLLTRKGYFTKERDSLKSDKSIANMLSKVVNINQKKGLDFIEITANSPSPFEAALMVNTYADVYKKFNLLNNRKQVTRIKKFLATQKEKKYQELLEAENNYKVYQLQGGAIELDAQAQSLITAITDLESKAQSTSIEISIVKKTLDQYKAELKRKDQTVSKYLENKVTEPYLVNLQQQIANIESQKDIAAIGAKKDPKKNHLIKDLDNKLKILKDKVKQSYQEYQSSILSTSPEEIKILTQQIFEAEVKYKSLLASYQKLKEYLNNYEKRFDKLPERTIDLARLERERLGSEKLYLLLEEKYQEALINEQSIDGNVLVLNNAEIPEVPSAPNRKRIILIGLLLGIALGAGYAIAKDSLDKTIKTPEEIEDSNLTLLGWIPKIENFGTNGSFSEFVVANKLDSITNDAFKSLRTFIRYSNVDGEAKAILVTSSAPSEGKSLISLNLAGSFAQVRKRTVIIDCDLRKPRLHNMLKEDRTPGFTDYLVGKTSRESIIRKSDVDGLDFITAGTIPPNPTEILDSRGMKTFMKSLRKEYDIIIVDSPPLITLADSVILSRLVDETILVALANSTDSELLKKSVERLSAIENSTFIGVLLNRFNLRKNYGSYYYRYAYSYSNNGHKKKEKIL